MSDIATLTSAVEQLEKEFNFWNGWALFFTLATAIVASGYFATSWRANRKAVQLKNVQAALLLAKDKQLSLDLAEKDLEIENARNEAAKANERAAEANMKAEQERLERVRLSTRVAPRFLGPEQKQAIIVSLKRFSGRQVTVVTYQQDVEAAVLAEQLIAALRQAGVSVEELTSRLFTVGGFRLGIHVSGPANEQDFVEALSSSFANDGQLATHNNGTEPVVPVKMATLRDRAVLILVGAKPPVVKPR